MSMLTPGTSLIRRYLHTGQHRAPMTHLGRHRAPVDPWHPHPLFDPLTPIGGYR